MNKLIVRIKPPTYATYGLVLALLFGIALFLRIYFPYDNVFAGDWVRFQLTDSWYHMRHIENLAQHFPSRLFFDPYLVYPGGSNVVTAPFFDLPIAFFAWVLGAGSPSKGVIETVGAYFPAILGALVTIPVYLIGKALFNRKAGLLAAALIAILPGTFLGRTLLGSTDHHAAEILFSTLTMLFLVLALKKAKKREVSFGSLQRREWGALRKPLMYSLLMGIALGFYLLSWRSGAFFVFIILAFAIFQYIIDHLRGRSPDYLCLIGVPAFLIALLMVVPFSGQYSLWKLQVSSLLIGFAVFLALGGISSLMTRWNIRQVYYPLMIAALVGIGLLILHLVDPSLLRLIVNKMSLTFNPTGTSGLMIVEMTGLSLSSAWEYFGPAFFISLVSLAVILYLTVKEGAADKSLLFIWSLITLIAAFGQQRLAYYFAINAALLTAYLSWRMLEFAGFKEAPAEGTGEELDRTTTLQKEMEKLKLTKKAKRKKEKAQKKRHEAPGTTLFNPRHIYGFLALVVVFFLVFYPNIGTAIDQAEAQRGPSDDWHEALVWLEGNTPEPFQDPDFYYELYEKPAAGENYDYPESAYGVMSWRDYGYWITYIAHRIPNANPGGRGSNPAGVFFTAQDESSASEVLDRLGSKYVVINYKMAIPQTDLESAPSSQFPVMTTWAGKDIREFFETYYVSSGSKLEPVLLYYPAYYQSMCTRLYIFAGEEVVPSDSTWVISYSEKTDITGVEYKEIVEEQIFATYQEAEEYLELYGSPNHRIVGNSPFSSPVPLDELECYELRFKSSSPAVSVGDRTISHVEVFEYLPQGSRED